METKLLHGSFPSVALNTASVSKDKTVLIMPVNLQGIMELTFLNRRFKHFFPKTYQVYQSDCYFRVYEPGDISFNEERDVVIFLLYYKQFEVGTSKEIEKFQLSIQLNIAVDKVLKAVEQRFANDMVSIYSPLIEFATVQNTVITSKCDAVWNNIKEGTL